MSQLDDLKKLIRMKKRRLQKLKEKQAQKGINTEPEILIEIEDLEIELEGLKIQQEELEYPLPAPLVQVLISLAEVAERNQSWNLSYAWTQSAQESNAFDLKIYDSTLKGYVIIPRLREDPIETLHILGLVKQTSKKRVILLPNAFKRAKQEREKARSGETELSKPQRPSKRMEILQQIKSSREKGESPDFREEELVKIDLAEADLAGADFSKANLSFADLTQANLEEATLSEANLCEAKLYRTHLKNANLRRTKFDKANLFRPTLTGADLSEVDLSKAEVDLEGADLKNAKLFETNLEGINLSGAILAGAEYSRGTRWPENFDPQKAGAVLRGPDNK